METIERVIDTAVKYIWEWPEAMPYFIVLLLGTGIFLTFRMRFIQLRKVSHSLAVIAGYYDDPNDAGEINHFQALTSALSATIGIGNISGVAIAIHYGGPGALFWMWVSGLVGMATKYSEALLGVKFRVLGPSGVMAGGPMYYLERGVGGRLGRVL
ncbi:MAG TPA: alanine:cation symporter family protein, partial [Candidatus Krumholzibacterium sp.]|nr:alanine:cation symporter family protein [Candidatus Krumholzibacterium sp.]